MTSAPRPPIDVRLMNVVTNLLVASLVVAVLATGLWWGVRNPAFDIKGITVTGDTEHNTPATLRAAVMQRINGNFFTLNLDSAKRAFESVPWVRAAVVQREFPNRLSVQLQEHEPIARWGTDGFQLLGVAGDVFRTDGPDADAAQLPLLQGPDGQAALVLQVYRQLGRVVAPLGVAITALELQPRGHWRLTLADGGEIELGQGTPKELVARFARFADTAGEVAARHQRTADDIESADLRYQHGYALRLRGVNTVGANPPRNKSN